MRFPRIVFWMSVVSLTAVSAALADRPPSDSERAAIEDVLQAEGFTSWEDIEFDDDDDQVWEVDDAIAADGLRYDLKLDGTYNIIERDRD